MTQLVPSVFHIFFGAQALQLIWGLLVEVSLGSCDDVGELELYVVGDQWPTPGQAVERLVEIYRYFSFEVALPQVSKQFYNPVFDRSSREASRASTSGSSLPGGIAPIGPCTTS